MDMFELTAVLGVAAVMPLAYLLHKVMFRKPDPKRSRLVKVCVLTWVTFLATYYTLTGWPF